MQIEMVKQNAGTNMHHSVLKGGKWKTYTM